MGAAAQAPPQRIEFAASSSEEAAALLSEAYNGTIQVGDLRDGDRITVSGVDLGSFKSTICALPGTVAGVVEGGEEFVVATLLGGRSEHEVDDGQERHGPGDVFLAMLPETRRGFRATDVRAHAISLPTALLSDTAAADPETAKPWAPSSSIPHPGGIGRWRRVTRLVDELLADPLAVAAPLTIGPAARLLAATVLTLFPSSTGEQPATHRLDAHPDTLRRARAFIDANPDLDITLEDIARAAYVSPRALQLAFRRHLNTTPTAYLRKVRIDCAHQQLQDADPEDGVTVARIAIDWGFANPSRFASYYREVYGRSPSDTLAS